jgi:hypothetical protein
MTLAKLSAWFVKEVARVRGISPQQARKDLKEFLRSQDVVEMQQIRKAIAALVPKQRPVEKISIQFQEVDGKDS